MTTTVVSADNIVSGVALNITSNNNYLVLDSTNLISTGDVGIKFANTVAGSTTTLNGYIYGDTNGIEMLAGGTNENLVVNGDVDSAGTGIALESVGSHVTIGQHATISGGTAGINITGAQVSLVNDGTILNDNINAGYGLQIGAVGFATVVNNGTIDGFLAQTTNLVLVNYGHINTIGTNSTEDSTVNVITNYGLIDGSIGLHHGDEIFNHGTINADIQGDRFFIKNDGLIQGDVSDANILVNAGTIVGDVHLASTSQNTLDSSQGHIIGIVTGGNFADTITGGSDDDIFIGAGGVDTLKGKVGDDILSGGSNNDHLTGGAGDDTLTGGADKDTFIFSGHSGSDVITDFTAGSGSSHDILQFSTNQFANFAAVQAHMTQSGADVLIAIDANDSVLLQHVTLGNLVSGDFLFG